MHEVTFKKQSRSMREVIFEKHKVVLTIKLHLKNIKSSMHEVTFKKHKVVLCIKLYLKNIKSFCA